MQDVMLTIAILRTVDAMHQQGSHVQMGLSL